MTEDVKRAIEILEEKARLHCAMLAPNLPQPKTGVVWAIHTACRALRESEQPRPELCDNDVRGVAQNLLIPERCREWSEYTVRAITDQLNQILQSKRAAG